MAEIETGIPQRYETRLKNALAHEIRVDLLRVLEDRPSSMRELADMFGETLSGIAGHVLELWREGSLEEESDASTPLADRRFRTTRVLIQETDWDALSPDERYEATVRILEGIIGEAMAALRSGHLVASPDEHLTWMPLVLDDRGRTETMEVLNRAFNEVEAIKEKCAERLQGPDRAIPVVVSIMGFERGSPRLG